MSQVLSKSKMAMSTVSAALAEDAERVADLQHRDDGGEFDCSIVASVVVHILALGQGNGGIFPAFLVSLTVFDTRPTTRDSGQAWSRAAKRARPVQRSPPALRWPHSSTWCRPLATILVLSLATIFSSHVLPAMAVLQLSARSTDLVFIFEFSFLVSLCFGIDTLASAQPLTDFSAVPALAASLQLSPALVLLAIAHLAVSFLFVSPLLASAVVIVVAMTDQKSKSKSLSNPGRGPGPSRRTPRESGMGQKFRRKIWA